jgi:hypothetical protein
MTTINFRANFIPGYYNLVGTGTPKNPVTGSFTITSLNPNTSVTAGANITLHNINVSLSNTGVFFKDTEGGLLEVFAIPPGKFSTGTFGVSTSFDAFFIKIREFKTKPTFKELQYSDQSQTSTFGSTDGSVNQIGRQVLDLFRETVARFLQNFRL